MGSPCWPILVCKIPEFWRQKLWDQGFVQMDSGNIHIKESKKPGFTFSTHLRINSKIFRLSLTMLWAIMTHDDQKYSYYDPWWPKTWLIVLQWPKIKYILGLFIFLNFVPNYIYGDNFDQVLIKFCLKWNLIWRGIQDCQSTIIFLNFITKIPFLSRFGPECSQWFV